MVGPAARKIAAADGMRYLTAEDNVDFDIAPHAGFHGQATGLFGAFCTSGGWCCGSQAYGVKSGSANWDGTPVSSGNPDWPSAQGRGLIWSYRHGCGHGARITEGVRDNGGEINALFFDGHVARLDDHASRRIEFWYPTGSIAHPGEGLTDVPENYEVP